MKSSCVTYIFSLFAVVLALAGCKKKELMEYADAGSIYFYQQVTNFGQPVDSLTVSFAADTFTRQELPLRLRIMGDVTKNKRSFRLTIDTAATTAVAGRDFQLPADSAAYIAGDSARRTLPLTLMRSPALRQKSANLVLVLKPNDQFQTTMPVQDHAAIPPVSAIRLKIVINDSLPEPTWWKNYTNYLGVFSRKKGELFVGFMNGLLSYKNFVASGNRYPGILSEQSILFQQYLNTRQGNGQPVLEEDGSLMKMGPDAQ
ncbi:DUF4843 domain-containing protein [Pseudoflavitalea rhizosphaerae]|uniref:DUF4843 domain-containing protein n=1 Tax=Pseudoflavitalea rhizosphaerae TaxID=1884793 RepID=UPI000F8F2F96|nr:DUF4843 domain-containing protein [Pseudoflavitalea rhizosphaerae]